MLGEWQAFEHHYGPLLVHERVDYGMAVLATLAAGGGDVSEHLPPWHRPREQSDDDILSVLRRLARPKGL